MKAWIDKKPEIRKFSKWEAAWLAGVIDGEGSIGLYDYGGEGRRVMITMSNTNRDFVARMREVIGCGSSIMRRGERIGGHSGTKPMFMYSLKGSNRCYWVLKQITSFLIVKKKKAADIICELEERPFGRWVNATPEYRSLHSRRAKMQWADPTIRQNRMDGIKRYYQNKFSRNKHT